MSARADRLRAEVTAERALPASERLANMLHATHTTADAKALLDEFRAEVLAEAVEAISAERLTNALFGADLAHNHGIADAVAAITQLLEAGESRG